MKPLYQKNVKQTVPFQKVSFFRAGLCVITLAFSLFPAGSFAVDRIVNTNAASGPGSLSQALSSMSTTTSDRFIVNIPTGTSRDLTLGNDLVNGARSGMIDYAAYSVNYVRVLLADYKYIAIGRGTAAGTGELLIGRVGAYNTNSTGKVHNIALRSTATTSSIGGGLTVLGSANISGIYNNNSINVDGAAVTWAGPIAAYGAGVFHDGVTGSGTNPAYTSSVSDAIISGNTANVSGSAAASMEVQGGGIFVKNKITSFAAVVDANKVIATMPATGTRGAISGGGGAFFVLAPDTISGTFTNNKSETTVTASPSVPASTSTASSAGGAFLIADGASTISNITVSGTSAQATTINGRAMATGGGAEINSNASSLTTIYSANFSNNTAAAISTSNIASAREEGSTLAEAL